MIREAVASDVPAIVAMGVTFLTAEYQSFITPDPASLTLLATALVDGDQSAIFVAGDPLVGMLAATLAKHGMSDEIVASEIAWWMDPAARGPRTAWRLLTAAKAWARAHGATRFQMIAPTDRVARFYERLGFQRVEIHYQVAL